MSQPVQEILNKIIADKKFSSAEKKLISNAFSLSSLAHNHQKRVSGEEYINHPARTAELLYNWGLDADTISAGLLHDIIEDTEVKEKEIIEKFGKEIFFLIAGVTKLKKIEAASSIDEPGHFESLKKMFFAMAEDIRVVLIKLADRYHNMETISYLLEEDRFRISKETMDIYASIADRLGMGHIKGQLEDMAFRNVYPEEYRWLIKLIGKRYKNRLKYIDEIKPEIRKNLVVNNIEVLDIHSRVKHLYSLYRKLAQYDNDPNKIHDLVALRVIVPDIQSCYEALGVIHRYYRPLPGMIKDYISMPKANGYQSLHTTVFCKNGKIVEIQIRTPDMHEHNENGIAAHWAYAASGKKDVFKPDEKEVLWVSELRKFLKSGSSDISEGIKSDFIKSRIFVFTPRGQIKDLPQGATPIDFAYSVHIELGHRTTGAKVNGKIVPLNYELKNGEVVEIMKAKKPKPSRDWLRIVKTSEARRRIRLWFKENSAFEIVKNRISKLSRKKN